MREITNRLALPADAYEKMVRQIVWQVAQHGPDVPLPVESPEAPRIQRVVMELINERFFMFPDVGSPAERQTILVPPASEGADPGVDRKMPAELQRYSLTPDQLAIMTPEEVRHFVAAEKWTDIQTELVVFSDLRFWLHWCRSGKHWYYADYHRQAICVMDRCLTARTVRGPRHIDELLSDYLSKAKILKRDEP
jgi:hypothetical protein